jgi:ABC-2 type transport system permease protein
MLVSLGAYGIGLSMVFSFGVTVAIDRGQKNDLLMRTSPLPPAVDLGSRVILAVVFSALTIALLFTVAFVSGVHLVPSDWFSLAVVLIAGSIPLLGLGFTIAYLAGANAATGIVNMLYMVLAFCSGLLVPLDQLPAFVQEAAHYLPTYHQAQLGWSVVGVPAENVLTSVAWVVAYSLLFAATSFWAYRRDTMRRFR